MPKIISTVRKETSGGTSIKITADGCSSTWLHHAGGNAMDTAGIVMLGAVLIMLGCVVWLVWKGGKYFDK